MSNNVMSFRIDKKHPCLAGHFPGNPIVPAVLILDEVISLICTKYALGTLVKLRNVKFIQPVLAEQEVNLSIEDTALAQLKFSLYHGDAMVAKGDIVFEAASVG